jgi:hypothetical protein
MPVPVVIIFLAFTAMLCLLTWAVTSSNVEASTKVKSGCHWNCPNAYVVTCVKMSNNRVVATCRGSEGITVKEFDVQQ